MPVYLPTFDPADFSDSTTIDNLYYPLPAGTISSFSGSMIDPDSGETDTERNDFFATFETTMIAGIEALVVRDTAYEDGVLIEDTLDWFAQDDDGNVWYMGEFSISYEYNDKGDFTGTSFEGSWTAGVDAAQPGWIMQATPTDDDQPYYQEYSAGVAEDIGEVVATGLMNIDGYDDVVQTADTSALEPGIVEYKYYAPGVGQIRVEEEIDENGIPQLVFHLDNTRAVPAPGAVDASDLAFGSGGGEVTVTFLSEDASFNSAIGAYIFDPATGEIGEGRILFVDTEDTAPGDSVTVDVPPGMSLGLFLVPGADDLGVELEDFGDGGLFIRNFATGDAANIEDNLAPLVTDADGNLLPIQTLQSVGNQSGVNFLNPNAGENALDSGVGDSIGIDVVSFEDGRAGTEGFDGDFNDAFVAISGTELDGADLSYLLDEIGISRIVGTDSADELAGTDGDDQLIGLDGNDQLSGLNGDDNIQAGNGNDWVKGGDGDDVIAGDEGNDRLHGGGDDDEIDGGAGNDRLFGDAGDDELAGDEGNDTLRGGSGFDTLLGGEGNDELIAGRDGARMAGGSGNDRMTGESGAADTFVFDLIAFGNDVISGFEDGTDILEIATYTGVAGFGDIEVMQLGNSTALSFADGWVRIDGLDADLIDASDFAFV